MWPATLCESKAYFHSVIWSIITHHLLALCSASKRYSTAGFFFCFVADSRHDVGCLRSLHLHWELAKVARREEVSVRFACECKSQQIITNRRGLNWHWLHLLACELASTRRWTLTHGASNLNCGTHPFIHYLVVSWGSAERRVHRMVHTIHSHTPIYRLLLTETLYYETVQGIQNNWGKSKPSWELNHGPSCCEATVPTTSKWSHRVWNVYDFLRKQIVLILTSATADQWLLLSVFRRSFF